MFTSWHERRNFMPDLRKPLANPALPHLIELSLLVDLEGRWDYLRKTSPGDLQDLHGRQKAYDAFHGKLVAYNKQYQPAHVSELLLNTPIRLGIWCRAMRDLYL